MYMMARAAGSGRGMYTRFSKRRRMAGSSSHGMLVAPSTRICLLGSACGWGGGKDGVVSSRWGLGAYDMTNVDMCVCVCLLTD